MKNMNENDVKSDTIADMNTKKTNGNVKGSSDPSHFFEINAGKSRIRHKNMMSFKFRIVLCRIWPFPTSISKLKWLGLLPLMTSLYRSFVKINFSEYKRRPDKYAEEQREDKYERLEDDREWERRRNRDLWIAKMLSQSISSLGWVPNVILAFSLAETHSQWEGSNEFEPYFK